MKKINNFVCIDSEYGSFIVNRHCAYQAEHMIKTGQPHIEPELKNILGIMQLLPKNCVVVDAGANIGLVSLPIAQSIAEKKGVVHAFEAQRMMAYALSGAAALNDLENVFIHHKALGKNISTIDIQPPDYAKAQDFGTFSLLDNSDRNIDNNQSTTTESIETLSIDSLDLPRLDFLKIDVEGMEIDVLEGGRETVERFLPWCWIEYWKVDIADIKKQFHNLDYDFYKVDHLNLLCVPLERAKNVNLTIKAVKI